MKNFILFFEEKEGTSPLMRMLDQFKRISVVHQTESRGWEPFDQHNCGAMPLAALRDCLGNLYSPTPDLQTVNKVYTRTATNPLEQVKANASLGFKMRFAPPPKKLSGVGALDKAIEAITKTATQKKFREMMTALLKENQVVVMIAVRQDIFRWALSKYHGDGSGKPGHLQFKVASGEMKENEIPKIHVELNKFESILEDCRKSHQEKQELMTHFQSHGIKCLPVLYEEFLSDKKNYFKKILNVLELPLDENEFESILDEGGHFKKVHSDDISSFVENHEEVMNQFGEAFVAWDS